MNRRCRFLAVVGLALVSYVVIKLTMDHKYEIERFLDDYGDSMGHTYKEAEIIE